MQLPWWWSPFNTGTAMSLPTLPWTGAAENADNEYICLVLAVGTGDSRDSGVYCLIPWCSRDGVKYST